MWRWARWVLLGVVLLVVGWAADGLWWHLRARWDLRRDEAIDARLLADMVREFPAGTARAKVVEGLRTQYPEAVGGERDVTIWLDKEPSLVWYCSFWKPYVVFSFGSGDPAAPLLKIERRTTGECL